MSAKLSEGELIEALHVIACQWIWDHNPNNPINQEFRRSAQKGRETVKRIKETKNRENDIFNQKMFDFLKDYDGKLKLLFNEIVISNNPIGKVTLNQINDRIRKAEERLLLSQFSIEPTECSTTNWALIGLSLSNRHNSPAMNFYNEKSGYNKSTGRGRPSKGLSIDYERAVWKVMIDGFILEFAETVSTDDSEIKVRFYTINDLLDAYNFAFDNPDRHPFINEFQELESKLKMRGISRDSLVTSFYRGESQRNTLWND